MQKFKRFASLHPLGFTFIIVLLFILVMGGAAALAAALLDYEVTDVTTQFIGQIVATVGLLVLLWRFGWLTKAGVTRLGHWRLWLLTLTLLVYNSLTALLAFFGTPWVSLNVSAATAPDLLHTTMAGVVEELLFRGVILYALVAGWRRFRWGPVAAVLVSAFLFGALHLVNLASGETSITLLQVFEAALSAILYGALVWLEGSLWPAVLLHSGLNLLVNAAVLAEPAFAVTTTHFLWLILSDLPLALFGLYLLSKPWRQPGIPDGSSQMVRV